MDSYLEVLESALLDRYLSAHEEDALIETATDLGLDRTGLDAVHRDYLLSMAAVAWEDRVITKAELKDLETVARLLELSRNDVAIVTRCRQSSDQETRRLLVPPQAW